MFSHFDFFSLSDTISHYATDSDANDEPDSRANTPTNSVRDSHSDANANTVSIGVADANYDSQSDSDANTASHTCVHRFAFGSSYVVSNRVPDEFADA